MPMFRPCHSPSRLFWARLALLFCIVGTCLFGCQPTQPTQTLGVLKTTQPNNLITFSNPKIGAISSEKFIIYNDGDVPVIIEGMQLQGDVNESFRVQPKPTWPVTLSPGESKGIGFEIEFVPTSAGTHRASLAFTSPNVDNVDDTGLFRVHLFANVAKGAEVGLVFSCTGGLNFGTLAPNTTSDKSCTATNKTSQTLTIDNVQYKATQGSSSSFRWLLPTLPAPLAPGEQTTISIRFVGTSPTTDRGAFWLDTTPKLNTPPQLNVSAKVAP